MVRVRRPQPLRLDPNDTPTTQNFMVAKITHRPPPDTPPACRVSRRSGALCRCDPTKPVPVRVESLLGLLTLGEKIAQLQTTHTGKLLPGESNRSVPHGYIERLGLETYTVTECLHGVCRGNSTVFPQSISLAATFNSALLHAVGEAIGTEARGWRNEFEAILQYPNRTAPPPGLACFSPQINVARVSELYSDAGLGSMHPVHRAPKGRHWYQLAP